jgi:hypothetical protein
MKFNSSKRTMRRSVPTVVGYIHKMSKDSNCRYKDGMKKTFVVI